MNKKSILHKIEAWLHDNPLTPDEHDLTARVESKGSFDTDMICTSAVERGGSTISAVTIKDSVDAYFEEMMYRLCDGFSINTGYFTIAPVIRGVFYGVDAQFDPAVHRVYFEMQQGSKLREALSRVIVEIKGMAPEKALISSVVDVDSGSENDRITPGNNLVVYGDKIKVAGPNPANGIFFVSVMGGAHVRVSMSKVAKNNPSELILIIPTDLVPGTYRIKVVTQYGHGVQLLKEPRTITFDRDLTVV